MLDAIPTIEILRAPPGALETSPQEMEAARQVQTRLLARSAPRLRSLDYGACYLPARGVGGDFYDFVEFGPNRLGIALGDVSGKGISAALMMASLHASLRSQYLRRNFDLAEVLGNVNTIFYEATAPHHYATLFLGDYDDRSRKLRYVNCGHPPPVIAHCDDSIERLEPTATLLGLFAAWECEVAEVTLRPGDTLLIASDGVTEAMSGAEEEFGESRLIETLGRIRHLPLNSMVRALVETIRDFCGSRQWDDLTVVAARAT
ncbi:MAG: PP2C family protein-serine/threonine phosphatase [bacterium]|nr:PP2C family protein-serine/threonine phosphatase [bacterium]